MATLRRRNNKWQVQVRIRNYGATSKTFINKKDALQWGREKEIELQRCAIKYLSLIHISEPTRPY